MPGRNRLRPVSLLPSLATLGNLACGVGAMIWALDAAASGREQVLAHAAWLLVLAAALDGLDGKLARLTRQASDLGAQLDSLADAVTFGVAPALVARTLVLLEGPAREIHMHPRLLVVAPILFAVCAVLRLARFNVEHSGEDDEEAHDSFTGLPTPAAAALPVGMVLFFFGVRNPSFLLPMGETTLAAIQEGLLRILPFALLLQAALMVSRVPYPHFAVWLARPRRPFPLLAEVVFLTGILLLEPELAVLLAGLLFTALPAVGAAWRTARQWLPVASPPRL